MKPAKRMGEILVEENLVLPEQLETALEKQKVSGKRLGQVLIDMGLISYDLFVTMLSLQSGIPHVWLRKGLIDPKVVHLLPKEKAIAYGSIPMFKVCGTLTLGMVDSADIIVIDDVENLTGLKVQPAQCREEDMDAALKEYYGEGMHIGDFLESFQESDVQVIESKYENLQMVEEMAEGARIINLVNLVLANAIKGGASDIHIQPDLQICRIRYRIDGALQEVMAPRMDAHAAIISRIKVMARMDIAERRIPLDGRIHVVSEGRTVDVRVSTMPTVLGEKVVMRLLDRASLLLDINDIGLQGKTLTNLKKMLKRPNGLLLVTGPTGSGKTTTLYSGISFISSVETNIVTIEDPVEYQLEMITQVQVNEEQGLTFAKILRSVLRQDPDVIMVGEIRDRDTAEVAIQAALTGHLVLATLHTNDSAGAIARLVEIGVEPYILTSALTGIVAQRLIRCVCPKCKDSHFPPPEFLKRIGWKGANTSFVIGHGCPHCFDSGLRGRQGIFELLEMDDILRAKVVKNPTTEAIRAECVKMGMRTLKDEAFRLVEEGMTSLDAVMRVVQVDEREEEIPANG